MWQHVNPQFEYFLECITVVYCDMLLIVFYCSGGGGMPDPRETVMARWGHVQSYLFPWMREEFDPCTEALERLIIVLDTDWLGSLRATPSRRRARA